MQNVQLNIRNRCIQQKYFLLLATRPGQNVQDRHSGNNGYKLQIKIHLIDIYYCEDIYLHTTRITHFEFSYT